MSVVRVCGQCCGACRLGTAQSIKYLTKWKSALYSLRMDNDGLSNPEFTRLGSHAGKQTGMYTQRSWNTSVAPTMRSSRTLSRDEIHLGHSQNRNFRICRPRIIRESIEAIKHSHNFNSEDGCRLSRNSIQLSPPTQNPKLSHVEGVQW
jgi:hypothetical protein